MENFTLNQGTETNPYPVPEKGTTTKERSEISFEYIKDLHKRTQKIESNLVEIQRKNTEQNNRNIEVLAVFVTLFTFISIETQLLRSGLSFLTAVGFSIVILGGLMIFLFSLRFFLENDWKNFLQYLLLLILGILMIVGGLFVIREGQKEYFNDVEKRFYSKDEIDQMLNENKEVIIKLENDKELFLRFKECIKQGFTVNSCIRLMP